jgi:hypothetical protein
LYQQVALTDVVTFAELLNQRVTTRKSAFANSSRRPFFDLVKSNNQYFTNNEPSAENGIGIAKEASCISYSETWKPKSRLTVQEGLDIDRDTMRTRTTTRLTQGNDLREESRWRSLLPLGIESQSEAA